MFFSETLQADLGCSRSLRRVDGILLIDSRLNSRLISRVSQALLGLLRDHDFNQKFTCLTKCERRCDLKFESGF